MAANSWSFAERECAAWRRCVAMTSLGSLLSSLLVSPTMNFSIALGGKASSSAPPTSSRRPFRPLRMTPTSNATWSLERAIAPLERARPPERAPIRLGGQTGVSLEGAREMTLIGEARTERDRADPLVAGLEAHGRPIEPQAAQVGADRRSEPEAKCARQVIGMHAGHRRQVANAWRIEEAVVELITGANEPERCTPIPGWAAAGGEGEHLEHESFDRHRRRAVRRAQLAGDAPRSRTHRRLGRVMHRFKPITAWPQPFDGGRVRLDHHDVRAGVAEPVIVPLFRGLRDGAVGLARIGVAADRDIERTLEHGGERGPLVHVGRKVGMGREKG